MKKALIAFAALGLVGAFSMTTTVTPAQAGLICGAKAKAKEGSICNRIADRRAARQAKRAARKAN